MNSTPDQKAMPSPTGQATCSLAASVTPIRADDEGQIAVKPHQRTAQREQQDDGTGRRARVHAAGGKQSRNHDHQIGAGHERGEPG